MAPSGDHGAAKAKDLRLLLPFSRGSLRIPDELAGEIGSGKARVVGAPGGKDKFWPVEVGRDGDGAFLGRGWKEFAAACGVGAGWLLVLRHRGGGELTVKAFDDSGCLRELGAPPAAEATTSPSKDASRKPQFISVLSQDSLRKMLLPSKFVRSCIPNEGLNAHKANIFGPLGKVCTIELEMNGSNLFFAGGWSQFLAFHAITEVNVLLLRYLGDVVFTLKVFTADGCQRESKHNNVRTQEYTEERQQALSAATWKCKSKNWPSSEGRMKPSSSISLPESSLQKNSLYKIGPPSWIEKQINSNTLTRELALATVFCDAIGLQERCTITLKTSMNSSESWQVLGYQSNIKNKSSYRLGQGWIRFCRDNNLKLGDICTFSVVETTLWHVAVTRSKEKINQFLNVNSSSTRKRMSNSNRLTSKGKKSRKGSRTYLNEASSKTKCLFEIGPPAWITKEINTWAIKKNLYLPPEFCEAIGIREPCIITLKISMSSTEAWQTSVVPYKNSSHHVGRLGWKSFCQENGIKVGDVCTFNIVETTVWHVTIARM